MTGQRLSTLGLLAPDLRGPLQAVLDELDQESIPLRVFETIRSPGRQTGLYARGRDPKGSDFGRTVTKARAYQSPHQYGLAVDLVFHVDGSWTWEEPEDGMWDTYHRIARSHGLVPLSFEKPHIQIPDFRWEGRDRGPDTEAGWLQWLRVMNGPEVS